MDTASITHSIQLSIAPVFFLTAVSGMVGAVAQRLARIIDRARVIEDRIRERDDPAFTARGTRELVYLRRRGHIANVSIGLLTPQTADDAQSAFAADMAVVEQETREESARKSFGGASSMPAAAKPAAPAVRRPRNMI